MNYTIEEQAELNNFFDWLLPLLPESKFKPAPPPSPELLDLAWQASQTNHDYLWENGLYHEKIIPLAAADGSHQTAPMIFESLGGDWSLAREEIPDDKEWQMLKFKCREEQIQKFQGKRIQVTIADSLYDLGEVNRRGVAESPIPYGLDFQQLEDVAFRKQE